VRSSPWFLIELALLNSGFDGYSPQGETVMPVKHFAGATLIACLALTTVALGQETGPASPTTDEGKAIMPGGEAGGRGAGTPVGGAQATTPETGTVITPGGEGGGQPTGTKVGSQTGECPQTAQPAQGADLGEAPSQSTGSATETQC
jgi:hypothetical protein